MASISEAITLAAQLHRAGRLRDAEIAYRQVLAADPNQVDALRLLGVVTHQIDQRPESIAYLQRAIELKGNDATIHNDLGKVLKAHRRWDESFAAFQRALALQQNFPEAHINLGNLLRAMGQPDQAEEAFRRALELQPHYAEAFNSLGLLLLEQGKVDASVEAYRRAVELKPNYLESLTNLGIALRRQGHIDDAIAAYRKALGLNPHSLPALFSLGNALKEKGRLDEAVDCYQHVLQLAPNHQDAQQNLGATYVDQGKAEEAICAFRRALELVPLSPQVHCNLGSALRMNGKGHEAILCYRRALELLPAYPEALNNLGVALCDQGNCVEATTCYRRAMELRPDYVEAHDNLLLSLQYASGVTLEALRDAHAEYDRRHARPIRNELENIPVPSSPLRGRGQDEGADRYLERTLVPHKQESHPLPLRIGFVSADLGRHPVGYFMRKVFLHLDRQQFQTFVYSDRTVDDDLTQLLRAETHSWMNTRGIIDERLDDQIRTDRIDILFDLAGHTAQNRLLVFARKPAPIQISWIGYMCTTGLTAMDYLLADRVEVPQSAEPFYTEKILRMPDGHICYDPPSYAPEVSALPALRRGQVTFGCFNNISKISSEIVTAWTKILQYLPAARLILKSKGLDDPHMTERISQVFAEHQITPQQYEFRPASPHLELLAEYGQIDIALDTFPYTGCLTTCEALWMGVPVISCQGETMTSRQSSSCIIHSGLQGTVAENLDDYVRLAVEFASDAPRLAAIRSDLRPRMAASPLCDGKRFAEHLAALLRETWERWLATG